MKNQNDLIISIAVGVLAIGLSAWFFFGKRDPEVPTPPTPVPLGKVALPPGTVVLTNALPNAGQAPGAGGGGGDAGGGGESGSRKKGPIGFSTN